MNIKRLLFLSLATAIIFTGCGATGRSGTTQSSLDTTFLQSQFWLPTEHIIYNENGEEILKNTFTYDKDGFLTSCDYSNNLLNQNRGTINCTITSNENQTVIDATLTQEETYSSQAVYTFNENDVLTHIDFGEDAAFTRPYGGNGVNTFLDENGEFLLQLSGKTVDTGDIELAAPYFRISLYVDDHVLEEAEKKMTKEEILLEYGEPELYYDETNQEHQNFLNTTSQQLIHKSRATLLEHRMFFHKYPWGVWDNKTVNATDQTVTTTVYYQNGTVGEKVTWRPVSKRSAQIFYHFDWDSDEIFNATLQLMNYGTY